MFPVEDLNAYEVQVQLAEELTYLSFLVLAEAEMARGDLDGALWWASKAIDESFAVDLVDPREQPRW